MDKKNIYTQLLAFQKLGISIKKGETNPHFKNKYADINEILSKVTKPLNELGVLIVQSPKLDGLYTRLIHAESETWVEGLLEFVQKADAQKLGSNITYNRRYSLVAMLGLEDEDDDGNKASASASAPKALAKKAITNDEAFTFLRTATDVKDLTAKWKSLPVAMQGDNEILSLCGEIKKSLTI